MHPRLSVLATVLPVCRVAAVGGEENGACPLSGMQAGDQQRGRNLSPLWLSYHLILEPFLGEAVLVSVRFVQCPHAAVRSFQHRADD